MVTAAGVLKLTDFGVSTDFSSFENGDGYVTDTKGTYAFWSPEMCDDTIETGGSYSAYLCDVWAAGVVLYIMLFGQLPFWSIDMEVMCELIADVKSKSCVACPHECSAEYVLLLDAMLAADPTCRVSFESCEAFAWVQRFSSKEREHLLKTASIKKLTQDDIDKKCSVGCVIELIGHTHTHVISNGDGNGDGVDEKE